MGLVMSLCAPMGAGAAFANTRRPAAHKRLIAAAKQGRQELETLWASERAESRERRARYAIQAINPDNSPAGSATWVWAPGNLSDSGTIDFSDVDLNDVHSVGAVTASAFSGFSCWKDRLKDTEAALGIQGSLAPPITSSRMLRRMASAMVTRPSSRASAIICKIASASYCSGDRAPVARL